MRLLCVSDTVVADFYPTIDARRLGSVDLVLSCGDLPPEYLTHLAVRLNAPLCYVRGNHDIRYGDKPPQGCTDLHGRHMEIGGLRLAGLEGSRWYNGGPIQYTEAEMVKIVRRLHRRNLRRSGVDVVVTHAPPRGIHDAEDLCHQGFDAFRWLIDRHGPQFFLHGHIHAHFSNPDQRVTKINQTRVVNCYGYCILEIHRPRPER